MENYYTNIILNFEEKKNISKTATDINLKERPLNTWYNKNYNIMNYAGITLITIKYGHRFI